MRPCFNIVVHINILEINFAFKFSLNLIKIYSNIMTFDIKTINRKNIEIFLNACLEIATMLKNLQEKYHPNKHVDDCTCKIYMEEKYNTCLDDICYTNEIYKKI